ncbi:MAG: hypothetical protein ABSE73_18345 [Planctomycetota bacterium]
MATEEENKEHIRKYHRAGLKVLLKQIQSRSTPGWDDGKAFEYLVLRAFELERAEVAWPYKVTIGELTSTASARILEEIDGFVWARGIPLLVESKDREEKEDIEAIAKLRNKLLRRTGQLVGAVFTSNIQGFTEPAKFLAQFLAPQVILLWTGDEVEFALKNKCFIRGLQRKYKASLMKGLPNYNIKTGTYT